MFILEISVKTVAIYITELRNSHLDALYYISKRSQHWNLTIMLGLPILLFQILLDQSNFIPHMMPCIVLKGTLNAHRLCFNPISAHTIKFYYLYIVTLSIINTLLFKSIEKLSKTLSTNQI